MPKPTRVLTPEQFEKEMKSFKFTRPLKRFQVHHTASPTRAQWRKVLKKHSGNAKAAALEVSTSIWRVHTLPKSQGGRGWTDGGMQTVTTPDGLIGLCRSWNRIPAGITGWNTGSFMTECVGDFRRGKEYPMPDAQYQSLVRQISAFQERAKLDNDAIMFHKEGQATACPGDLEKGPLIQAVAEWKERDLDSIDASDAEVGVSSIKGIIDDLLSDKPSKIHTIKRGDTLWAIARKHDVSLDRLIALNSIADPGNVAIGTKLKIPS
jgi:hypothetical protein